MTNENTGRTMYAQGGHRMLAGKKETVHISLTAEKLRQKIGPHYSNAAETQGQ